MSPQGRVNGRDVYIDALRGACILAMVFYHLADGTWAAHASFAGTFAFFNGAEGFVFLSGFVFAKVYRRRLREWGPDATGRAALRRAGQIYRWHVLLLLCLVCCAWLFPQALVAASARYGLAVSSPWAALWRGALLVYQPKFFDILPLYILFLPAGWFFTKRELLGSRWLPIASIAIWTTQQFRVTAFASAITFGVFNPAAYQMLFVLGLWFGGLSTTGPWRARLHDVSLLGVSIAVCVTCAVLSHPGHTGLSHRTVGALMHWGEAQTDKDTLGWLRVINFFAAAHLAYYFQKFARRLPLDGLAALGKRSLEVFAAHLAWFLLLREVNDRILHKGGASIYGAFVTANIAIGAISLSVWDRRMRRLEASSLGERCVARLRDTGPLISEAGLQREPGASP